MPVFQFEYRVGDKVRLIGPGWMSTGLQDEITRVAAVEPGYLRLEHPTPFRKDLLTGFRDGHWKVAFVARPQEGKTYYGGHTAWDFIEEMNFGFNLGNVVKYVTRAGKKDSETELQDLLKAKDYLDREIERVRKKQG